MRIAVDVLGGDHAPQAILDGVAKALAEDFRSDELLLIGPSDTCKSVLQGHGVRDLPQIFHAELSVGSSEKPIEAMRQKPNASIFRAIEAVHDGDAGGLISFGNTGAAVAGSSLKLGLLPGLRRPGIAVAFQGTGGRLVLLDAGANPEPKAIHLHHYGLMGSAYSHDAFGVANPKVGLLNIGGEAGKGSALAREAHAMLASSSLNFVGNVEGQDVFQGAADVVVTDGFTGNTILKVVEGFTQFLLKEITTSLSSTTGTDPLKEILRQMLGASDYSEVGGAVLLGVQGVVLIGHGRSQAEAVPPALRAVRNGMQAEFNRHITEMVAQESVGDPS